MSTIIVRRRNSYRLQNFDYSSTNYYFVTICTKNHKKYFGRIVRGQLFLNKIGINVKKFWLEIPIHYKDVVLDEFIVMPNHIHGIIFIKSVGIQNSEPLRNEYLKIIHKSVEVQNSEPLHNRYQKIVPRSLGSIVRGFKIGVTKYCRADTKIKNPWQRNFYDHIIRNDLELEAVRSYIRFNYQKYI